MFKAIQKRDGREVVFDETKITDAIFKAARAVGGEDRQTAMELTIEVLKLLRKQYNGNLFGVEDVQDMVEKVLIESGHARTAKAYILYRARRTRMRDAKGELMDAVEEILEETNRENANISNSPSAKMLQIASAASKKYYLNRLIPEEMAQAHMRGDLHIHDLDFYGKTLTCVPDFEYTLIRGCQGEVRRVKFDYFNSLIDNNRENLNYVEGVEVLNLDGNQILGRSGWTKINKIMRRKLRQGESLYRIKTRKGLPLHLTGEHKLPVLRAGYEFLVQVKEIVKGDRLLISRQEFEESLELPVLDLFIENRHKIPYGITIRNAQKLIHWLRYKYDDFKFKLMVGTKQSSKGGNILSGDEFAKLAETYYIPYEVKQQLTVTTTKGSKSLPAYLAITPELMRLLGYILAEGHINISTSSRSIAIINEDPNIQADIEYCVKNTFNDHTTTLYISHLKNKQKGRLLNGSVYVALLQNILGAKINAGYIDIPDFVLNASKDLKAHFLQGLFDGDGHYGKERITYCTVSEVLAEKMVLLLQGLEVSSTLYHRETKGTDVVINGSVATTRNYDTYVINIMDTSSMQNFFHSVSSLKDTTKTTKYAFSIPGRNLDPQDVIAVDEINGYDRYVFDLETAEHWFTVNDYVVHNCLQIPLNKLLMEGFNTGHGYIRPPKRPTTATAQAAIILQSSQNDMHGGQSYASFDRDIAPFVENASDFETYQAMEALIHNLNSMHSLKGSERIWVLDKKENKFFTVSMDEFHQRFEKGRYAALSISYDTGETELKDITDSMRHYNFNRILQVKLKSGQKAAVTDNHSMMTLDAQGEISTSPPESLNLGLTPAKWSVGAIKHIYDLSKYPVSRKYSLEQIELNENLAWLLGLYVAEGSADGSSVYLALFDRDLEEQAAKMLRETCSSFSTRLKCDRDGKPRDLVCRVGKRFVSFVRDICGVGAMNKRVPSEIFFSSEEVIRSFLDGYFSGDGTVGKNRLVATTISQELRDGIYLLLTRLGLPSSLSQSIPQTQFAVANKRYKIAVGGYYATSLDLSGPKGEQLADLYRVTMEQTPYDYEYLRPLIADVYGAHCRNAWQYRLKPLYLEELIADLKARVLSSTEKELIVKICSKDFWLQELARVLPQIITSERDHLKKLVENRELPVKSKYLQVYLPYKQWLKRFLIPEDLGARRNGGRIHDECRSPVLVMRWASAILQKDEAMRDLLAKIKRALNVYPISVNDIDVLPHETYVYDISVQDNENFLTAEGIFVHNSRAGAQVPFSSINVGTETSESARRVVRNLLLAYEAGLGNGENPIFPNIIFRVKEGINFNPGDPNYDLFKLAIQVAGKRLNPTFSFMDSSFNNQFGNEVSYMGCRTRVMANRRGPEVADRRGNLSFTTINLPRVAIKSERKLDAFYRGLSDIIDLTARQLYHRYQVQCRLKVKDMPFIMGQKLYLDSEDLKPDDPIEEAIKHGTLSVGFIGLAEALTALTGRHHGQDEESQAMGQEIVAYMREKIDEAAAEYNLNYTLLGTPAEGLSGRFVKLDRKEFGLIPGVTIKDYYTNSFHVPVDFPISSFAKIGLEGTYHKYCNAGHISYVEMSSPPLHNPDAVEAVIRHMRDSDMGYGGINYPVDFCTNCSLTGVFNEDLCPRCGSMNIRRVRRITGYLSTTDRFNDSKLSELSDRIPHK
jgi:ribonucleoside-triphosphate reductase